MQTAPQGRNKQKGNWILNWGSWLQKPSLIVSCWRVNTDDTEKITVSGKVCRGKEVSSGWQRCRIIESIEESDVYPYIWGSTCAIFWWWAGRRRAASLRYLWLPAQCNAWSNLRRRTSSLRHCTKFYQSRTTWVWNVREGWTFAVRIKANCKIWNVVEEPAQIRPKLEPNVRLGSGCTCGALIKVVASRSTYRPWHLAHSLPCVPALDPQRCITPSSPIPSFRDLDASTRPTIAPTFFARHRRGPCRLSPLTPPCLFTTTMHGSGFHKYGLGQQCHRHAHMTPSWSLSPLTLPCLFTVAKLKHHI